LTLHSDVVVQTDIRQRTAPTSTSVFAPAYRLTSAGILILITLIAFEAMAVAAALPTAARELHGIGAIGWAFTAFLVANVIGLVVSGQICDARGPRLATAAGLVAFVAGLAVSGTATTMAQLVAGRAIQGLGAGLLITAIYVVLGEAFPAAVRPKIFAAMSTAWVLPALLGPIVAGTLSEHASWRWVFLGLLPFVVLGAALMVPVLRTASGRDRTASARGLAEPRRIVRALVTAAGIAALEAAGQRPSPITLGAAVLGGAALLWGLAGLLPAGTWRVRRGVSAPIVLRGLLAGAFFGTESLVPLMLMVQHGFAALAAGLPLVITGLTWTFGSWWQGRESVRVEQRVNLIRAGFAFVAIGAVGVAIATQPSAPGWLLYLIWAPAGIGAGLTMSSVGVLLLLFTNDANRGTDSAALQLSDAVTTAITTGIGGVLVAAAARGVFGYTAAFTTLFAAMALVALLGLLLARQARPPTD
jgi:MFS family permease